MDLENDWSNFQPLNLQLVSIMVDPKQDLLDEATYRGLKSTIAYDSDKAVSEEYKALEASMHPGAKPGHTFILVNEKGQIIWRWDWSGHGEPMYVEVNDLYNDISGALQGSS